MLKNTKKTWINRVYDDFSNPYHRVKGKKYGGFFFFRWEVINSWEIARGEGREEKASNYSNNEFYQYRPANKKPTL